MLPEVWNSIKGEESYTAESLKMEGFIHCSFVDQLKGVLERYYPGVETVVILEIDPEKLTSGLKLEKATNDELFPHIYGMINRDSVVAVSVRNNADITSSDADFIN